MPGVPVIKMLGIFLGMILSSSIVECAALYLDYTLKMIKESSSIFYHVSYRASDPAKDV